MFDAVVSASCRHWAQRQMSLKVFWSEIRWKKKYMRKHTYTRDWFLLANTCRKCMLCTNECLCRLLFHFQSRKEREKKQIKQCSHINYASDALSDENRNQNQLVIRFKECTCLLMTVFENETVIYLSLMAGYWMELSKRWIRIETNRKLNFEQFSSNFAAWNCRAQMQVFPLAMRIFAIKTQQWNLF